MKKLLLFLMVFVSLFTLSSCNETTPTPTPTEPEKSETPEKKPEVVADSEGFVIHYVRPDSEYAEWNLWLWVEGGEGAAYNFGKEVTESGVAFKTTWTDFGVVQMD